MSTSDNNQLFSRYDLGNIALANRVVMAPMTRSRAMGNIPNDLMATYYRQRANAGLIITEGTSPSPNGLGYPRIPGVFSPEQVEGWRKTTQAVHEAGGRIFLQLMHTGRVSHPRNLPSSATVVAPSAVALEQTKMYVDGEGELEIPAPIVMQINEIEEAVREYRDAAKNAIAAGFDGVELHGANGYLIQQFINPSSNHRSDEYGGSIENRIRFAIEVARAVVDAIGAERVGMRLSPHGVFNEMGLYEDIEKTYAYLATHLSKLGLVYLHLVDHSSMGAPEVPDQTKLKIRSVFENTLILSGGYDKERAENDIEAGHGDLVAFGKPFISNPDLVERMKNNAPLADPDFGTFYTPGEKGYTDYPTL